MSHGSRSKSCDESHNNCNRQQHTMKMYIQPNKLSHNIGLILVVILFDTFFISWTYHKYCNISQNVAFWVSKSNPKKHNTWVYLRWSCESTCIFISRINTKVRISTTPSRNWVRTKFKWILKLWVFLHTYFFIGFRIGRGSEGKQGFLDIY